jgi:hypothetical protein
MKITKTYLRKVIQEELAAVMDEDYEAMITEEDSPEDEELDRKKDVAEALMWFAGFMKGDGGRSADEIMAMILAIAKRVQDLKDAAILKDFEADESIARH